ncbi:hypothetical protein CCR85_12650 [Rhodothalassium salexigens]|nr:hypothetical protein [Rhodothalassium salexigens]
MAVACDHARPPDRGAAPTGAAPVGPRRHFAASCHEGGAMTHRWIAGLAVALLGACTGAQTAPPPLPFIDTPEVDTGTPGPRDFGPYVAGRFASEIKDPRAVDFYRHALAQDPDDPGLLNATFTLALAEGRLDTAADMAERLAPFGAGNLMAETMRLLNAIDRGDDAQALRRLDAIDSNFFRQSLAPIIEAWLLARQGQGDAALARLDAAGQPRFNRVRVLTHRALVLDYLGRTKLAEAAYQLAIDTPGGADPDLVGGYGNLLIRTGRADEAVALYSRLAEAAAGNRIERATIDRRLAAAREGRTLPVLARSPEGGIARPFLAVARDLSRNTSIQPAIVFARFATFTAPDLYDAHLLLGHLLSRQERFAAALDAYGVVERADTPLASAARYGAAVALAQTGRSDEAVAALERHLEVAPEDSDSWITLGDLKRQDGDFDAAEDAYSRAIVLLEVDETVGWYPYFARAIAYEQTDRWPEAEADLKRAMAIRPDQADVLNYLGYSWIDRGLHLDAGMDLIERAMDLEPGNGFIIDSMGWAHYLRGNYDQAVAFLEQAIVEEPDDPTISDHLGDAYWQVGRHLEARYQWEHALTLTDAADTQAAIRDKLTYGLTLAGTEKTKTE